MAINRDGVGSGNQGLSLSTLTVGGIVPNGGDAVVGVVAWSTNTGANIGGATFDGNPMTQIGSSFFVGNSGGFACYMAAFKIENVAGDGVTSKSISFNIASGTAVGMKGNGEAYSGVASVGTTLYTASGNSTAPAVSVTSATNHVAVNAITNFSSGATIPSYTQTSDWNTATTWGMVMGHAAGASTVSFGGTLGASSIWGAIGFDLVPVTSLQPGGATIGTTPGTPVVTTVGGVQPPGATITATGGSPTVLAPTQVTPGGATIVTTGGHPNAIPGPLNVSLSKLAGGQNSIWQIAGDSTAWGWADSQITTKYGWAGRLAIEVGQSLDVNVVARPINYPTSVAYNSPVTLYTALRGALAPTLTVYLGGWPGAVIATIQAYISSWFPVSNPDVVFIQDGFNEASTSSFTTNYLALISSIQTTYCPGATIIVTTANNTTATAESGSGKPTFASLWAAMVTAFLPGESLPLSPALQLSTAVGGVWVLDTQQANLASGDLNNDGSSVVPANSGLHPVASGYDKQASWMFAALAPGVPVPTNEQPGGASIATTGGAPSVTAPNTVQPGGATVTETGGTPVVSKLTTETPSGATITGTGGTPGVSAPMVLTPLPGSTTLAGRAPIVDHGSGVVWVDAPKTRVLVVPADDRTLVVPA